MGNIVTISPVNARGDSVKKELRADLATSLQEMDLSMRGIAGTNQAPNKRILGVKC